MFMKQKYLGLKVFGVLHVSVNIALWAAACWGCWKETRGHRGAPQVMRSWWGNQLSLWNFSICISCKTSF